MGSGSLSEPTYTMLSYLPRSSSQGTVQRKTRPNLTPILNPSSIPGPPHAQPVVDQTPTEGGGTQIEPPATAVQGPTVGILDCLHSLVLYRHEFTPPVPAAQPQASARAPVCHNGRQPAMIDGNTGKPINWSARKGRDELGYVVGIMCGGETLDDVARPRQLPEPRTDSAEASDRFRGLIRELAARCEAALAETNSWIYLAGQHPTARQPFIHYVSPRLRKEGGVNLDKVHTHISHLMRSLRDTRRQEAVDLGVELVQTQERLGEAERAVHEKEKQLQAKAAKIVESEARLEQRD
ncbi:hypothetical protein NP233_g1719 [Leucocoprinus birnbaumii]|uniref:Uncharacterized protein n=1 Tax=Leucocoprinus birnbaumii TaxID=56174 RepID=A0AAD5YUK0_9AGAR|nr:hypothetical protein NP233_g1719 [Leucocoprinus birnbaumii]